MNDAQTSRAGELVQANRRFYDSLWSAARLVHPDRFNTWPLVQTLLARTHRRLEIAPGLRPRLPILGTQFVDISLPALARLRDSGGHVALGAVTHLPLPSEAFDLVCVLDILEHVEDDERAWEQVARVATKGASVLISTPLHSAKWCGFDDFVGHYRRYDPPVLLGRLEKHGLIVEQSAVYGMQPRSSKLLDLGVWWMTHRRAQAMRWYNRIWMPLALRMEKPLVLVNGMTDLNAADEVLLVCRKK